MESDRNWEGVCKDIDSYQHDAYSLLRDLALDRGETEMAEALEWMQARGKWPIQCGGKWYWIYYQRDISKGKQMGWTLPGNVDKSGDHKRDKASEAIILGAAMVVKYLRKKKAKS